MVLNLLSQSYLRAIYLSLAANSTANLSAYFFRSMADDETALLATSLHYPTRVQHQRAQADATKPTDGANNADEALL